MFSVSARIPCPANAASPCMITGTIFFRSVSPARCCFARARPTATGSTASRWLGFETRCIPTFRPSAVTKFPVAPMWYFTSPPPSTLRGSTSSNRAKTSAAARPTMCTITFSRPRWLIATTACSAPWFAAAPKIESSSGSSEASPSSEYRFVPRYRVCNTCSKISARTSQSRIRARSTSGASASILA